MQAYKTVTHLGTDDVQICLAVCVWIELLVFMYCICLSAFVLRKYDAETTVSSNQRSETTLNVS